METKTTIKIKNMCCNRCIMVVTDVFKGLGLQLESVKLGEAIYIETPIIGYKNYDDFVAKELKNKGFEIIVNREDSILEQVKIAIMELVNNLPHMGDKEISIVTYLQKKINHNYRELRSIFLKRKKITIERYFILQKIEKVKELIEENKFNFTEIADCMGYKATQHLAGQFKRITGLTMNQYKISNKKERKFIDEI